MWGEVMSGASFHLLYHMFYNSHCINSMKPPHHKIIMFLWEIRLWNHKATVTIWHHHWTMASVVCARGVTIRLLTIIVILVTVITIVLISTLNYGIGPNKRIMKIWYIDSPNMCCFNRSSVMQLHNTLFAIQKRISIHIKLYLYSVQLCF